MTVQVERQGGDLGKHSATALATRLVGIAMAALLLWCDAALAAGPRVILLRGWFGVFSTGLDSIADQLKAQGIEAEVAGHLYWQTALANIVRERSAGPAGPLVLIGHSQGANNVIDMARALEAKKITVDLLVTLSPYLQNAIPANVVKAVDFYTPSWGQPLTGDRGFRGNIRNVDLADDLAVNHISIDKSTKVQTEIMREIAALTQPGGEKKKF
jgi:hypothetical protein